MKSLFNIIAFIFTLLSVNSFSETRFTEKEKSEFISEIRYEIEENKKESGKPFEIHLAKFELYQKIAELKNVNAITLSEEKRIIKRFDDLIEQAKKNKIDQEEAVIKVIEEEIKRIDSTQIQCVKEGNVCNDTGCCAGLTCANVPNKKLEGEKCSFSGSTCSLDSECCSGSCELNVKTNKKSCAEVKRCFRPLGLGANCSINPVCGQGECLPFDTLTSGFEIAKANNSLCKSNNDCRSKLCDKGRCRENRICKECVREGKKVERGLKCCEGLFPSAKGKCIPDAPPMVLPEI